MEKIFSILWILILPVCVFGQQVETYIIDVTFFPEDAEMWSYPVNNTAFMRGETRVKLRTVNTQSIDFYLHGELKIDSIVVDNAIDYTTEKVLYRRNYSQIALKTTIAGKDILQDKEIRIHYSGFMNPSRARSLSDYMRIDKHEGVFLRSFGYSLWFPVFLTDEQESHIANFESVTLNLPTEFKGIVVGDLVEEKENDNRCVAEWRPGPVDIRNIQCTADNYQILSKENLHIYFSNNKNQAKSILTFTDNMKTFFHQHFRSIEDNSSLYILQMPKYGNISAHNVIGISDAVYTNFEKNISSKLTIAHELVHPFVQTPISQDNPFYALITEGFPSFFHLYGMAMIDTGSDFDIHDYMERIEESYLRKKKTGKTRRGYDLPADKPILKIQPDEIGQYKDRFILSDRVRLFLYDLWQTMGDENFAAFLKELFQLTDIDYDIFEHLVLSYLPDYGEKLTCWLKTIQFPPDTH